MKKSLLFIIPSLGGGGAERSLITLLSMLDYGKYDVDLMLFRNEGFFIDEIPADVNIIDGGEDYRYFDGNIKKCLFYCLRHRKIKMAYFRIKYMIAFKKKESTDKRKKIWKYLKFTLPEIQKKYDVSIGYLEGNSIYYCIDKTKANKRIGYIHSDYHKLEMNKMFDEQYLKKLDCVVTVSSACAENLTKEFPESAAKTVVIENIISSAGIKKLAASAPDFSCGQDFIKLLTVARISMEKGIDLAVRACEILLARGYKICWFVIGEGDLKKNIDMLIKEKCLEKYFILLGGQKNPYKFMNQCDIYVQPSRYEGKSIALEEAKILEKPIVATGFSTVCDQIEDGFTGLITTMEPESIADKIEQLILNPALREKLSENLKAGYLGNENEINKFYCLVNS